MKFRFFLRLPIARAHDPLGQILRKTIRANVDQLRNEIGIDCGGLREDIESHGSCDFHIVRKRRGRVDKNILPLFHWPLVAWPGLKMLTDRNTTGRRSSAPDSRDRTCTGQVFRRGESTSGASPSPDAEFAFPAECRKYLCLSRTGERPVILVAPLIGAHHKNLDSLRSREFVGDILEEVVVPVQGDFVLIKGGVGPKSTSPTFCPEPAWPPIVTIRRCPWRALSSAACCLSPM